MRITRRTKALGAAIALAVTLPLAGAPAPAQAGLLDGLTGTVTTTVGGTVNGVVCTLLSCPTPPTSTATTSLADLRAVIGADRVAATGAGIDVAVIDSGISPVGPLAAPGRVLHGPDLSFDGDQEQARHLDAMGHGTHIAGVVNAVAPGARLVNVKVGDAQGNVDITQVIAALDWVVEHKDSDGLNVRVVNLSLGYDTALPAALNPLNAAADRAWRAGIVVVSSAGNDGRGDYRLSAPASNPNGIAVGAADTLGSRDRSKAVVADFSAYGGVERRPDVLTPGARVASLRVPGSVLDVAYPGARRGDDLFRGSGTSQAAAAVSGAAAQLLELRPELTPAQVRALLKRSADAIPRSALVGGAGLIDVADAAAAPAPTGLPVAVEVPGTASLSSARGATSISVLGIVLNGDLDLGGNAFDSVARQAFLAAGHQTWSGGSWNGGSWNGGSWNGGSWNGGSWNGGSWNGGSWNGGSWNGGSWNGGSWNGGSWNGGSWNGGSWNGGSWNGGSWNGGSWNGGSWNGGGWA